MSGFNSRPLLLNSMEGIKWEMCIVRCAVNLGILQEFCPLYMGEKMRRT